MDWYDEEDTHPRKRRQRLAPVKKWTDEENRAIIDYVYKNGNFELPTARIYYDKMATALNIFATFKLFRSKLRNMRDKFLRTRDMIKQLELSGAVNAKNKIERIRNQCLYYDKMEKIFERHIKLHDRKQESSLRSKLGTESITDSGNSCQEEIDIVMMKKAFSDSDDDDEWGNDEASLDSRNNSIDEKCLEVDPNFNHFDANAEKTIDSNCWISDFGNLTEPLSNQNKEPLLTGSAEAKSEVKHANVDKFLRLESRKQRLKEDRFKFEKQKHRLDYELNLRKQKFEEEQWKQRIDFQKLELQSKERMLKYELALKYGKDLGNIETT